MSKITVRKFDRLLSEKNIPLPFNYAFNLPNSWGRAMSYSVLILFFNPEKTHKLFKWRYKNYNKAFKNFNFKKQASSIDFLLSLMNIFFCFLTILFLIILITPAIIHSKS
jgi:hypothetical protein